MAATDDFSYGFMSRHERKATDAPIVIKKVNIAMANRASFDSNLDIMGRNWAKLKGASDERSVRGVGYKSANRGQCVIPLVRLSNAEGARYHGIIMGASPKARPTISPSRSPARAAAGGVLTSTNEARPSLNLIPAGSAKALRDPRKARCLRHL